MSQVIIIEPQSSGLTLIDAALRLGLEPIVMTAATGERHVDTRRSMGVKKQIIVDTNDEEAAVTAACHEAALPSSSIVAVVAGFEYYVPLAARIASELGLPGLSLSAAKAARLKNVMRTTLAQAGVPIPRFAVASSPHDLARCAEHVGFPAVVKPSNLSGSIQVRKVTTLDELHAGAEAIWSHGRIDLGLAAAPEVLIEEYIGGQELSVEGYVTPNNQPTFLSITKKLLGPEPHFVEMGHVVRQVLSPVIEQRVLGYVTAVLKALGIDCGPFHAELRLRPQDEQPFLMEVAARLPGDSICELIHLSSGHDLAEIAMRCLKGDRPELNESETPSAAGTIFFSSLGVSTSREEALTRLSSMEGFVRGHFAGDSQRTQGTIQDFSGRMGQCIFIGRDAAEVETRLESARRALCEHILIINRWDDDFADYSQYIDHGAYRVSYITTAAGLGVLPRALASAVTVVSAPLSLENVEEAARGLMEVVGPIDRVLALSEYDLLTAAELRQRLGVRGPKPSNVSGWRDKVEMKRRVGVAGLPVPAWRELQGEADTAEFAAEHGFPLVLKPRAAAASAGVIVVENADGLARATSSWSRKEYREHEIEAFITGDILHVDGIVADGELWFAQASIYLGTCLDFAQGMPLGSVFIDDLAEHERILEFASKALEALSLRDGAFHLELFRRADGQLVFLEVGARVGGGEIPFVIRDVNGVDLVGAWIRLLAAGPQALGLPPRHTGVAGGFLMVPEPPHTPVRVESATSLVGHIEGLYREIIPARGEVLDGQGGYGHIGGRFHFRGSSTESVRASIGAAVASYRLHVTPLLGRLQTAPKRV